MRTFALHLLEMTVAMVLGMVVLGAAFRELHLVVFGSGFEDAWHRHVSLVAGAMAFNMTLPMVLWMRYRGSSWRHGGEMAGAMVVPAVALLALAAFGLLATHLVLPLQMAAMLPAMAVVLLVQAR